MGLQRIGSAYSYLTQEKVMGELVCSVEWRNRIGVNMYLTLELSMTWYDFF